MVTRSDMNPGPPWKRLIVDIPGLGFEPKPPRARAVRPDSECDGWSTDKIALRSASLRGDRHRYYGQPRQDAVCATAHDGMDAVVFAVADGVSGAEASEIGAADACHAAASAIATELDRGAATLDCVRIARHVSGRLRWRAGRILGTSERPDTDQAAKLVATTLVAGAARAQHGALVVQMFRVGDSSAWTLDQARETQAQGTYAPVFGSSPATADSVVVSNEVTALPEVPEPLEQATVTVRPGQVLIVGTDGFGVPLGDGDGEIGALFARTLASVPSPLWLAHVLDFSRETFDDDRTLLALWPVQE